MILKEAIRLLKTKEMRKEKKWVRKTDCDLQCQIYMAFGHTNFSVTYVKPQPS